MSALRSRGLLAPLFFGIFACPAAHGQSNTVSEDPGARSALPGSPSKATELFQKGLSLYEKKDYAAAINCFTEALIHRPHDRKIQEYVIVTGRHIMDRESRLRKMSIPELQKIVETAQKMLENRRKEMNETLERLKLAYTQSQLQDPKSLLKACRGVDILMEISLGDDPESRRIKEYIHSICENLEKAMQKKIAAIKADIHRISGYVAFCRSDWLEASQEWGKALQLNPEDGRLRKLLSQAQSRHQKEKLAKRIERLMADAKKRLKSGMHEEASAAFEAVLKLEPAHETALNLLEKTQKKAREDKRKASISYNESLALENQKKGMWIEAAQKWLNILELDPLHPGARKNLEEIRANLSESVRAISHPPASPSRSRHFYTLGLLSYSEGNLEEAFKNFKTSLELDPLNELAQRALKRVEEELKYQ